MIQPQLKIPSPAEVELDRVRDSLWRDAKRDPKRLFSIIRKESREIDKTSLSKNSVRKYK